MRKWIKANSSIIQGVYFASGVLELLMCCLVRYVREETLIGIFCRLTLLYAVYPWVLSGLAMPICLAFNVMACLGRENEKERVKRIVWAIASLILAMVLFLVLPFVFVETTGGV